MARLKFSLLSVLSLSSFAAASPLAAVPFPTQTLEPADGSINAQLPEATLAPRLAAVAKALTITFVNNNGADVTTVHNPPNGAPGPGRIQNGAKSVFVVQGGWAGNVAINDAKQSVYTVSLLRIIR
jgi:hypothetical protein